MDDDASAVWKDHREASKAKRASNRENSAQLLLDAGIVFTTNNGGAHLIVEGKENFIDFWPGTGKWNSRCGKKGFGVRNLIAFVNGEAR